LSAYALPVASVHESPPARLRLPKLSLKVIHISDPHRKERRRVEAFVEATYAKAYGSVIEAHYPTLMSVQDEAGVIFAAVGFRTAAEGPLFLEQYLDVPVEAAVAAASVWHCRRETIVEIGHLASNGRGATVILFRALARYLQNLGCEVATATATRDLRQLFAKAGFATVELAPADAACLPDAGAKWGSYYQREPRVLAGAISAARAPLDAFAARADGSRELHTRLHFRVGNEE